MGTMASDTSAGTWMSVVWPMVKQKISGDRFTSINNIYRTLNYLYIYHQKSGIILKKKREGRK
ncbi:hypothetical protein C3V39_06055 [Prevotella sp. oral taxon 820]|nr:hypothetical protein C3V39_06055 [Prevotella sp. oral taxon 820]